MTEPFPAPFRQLLGEIMRRAGRQGQSSRLARRRRWRVRRSESGTFSGHRGYTSGDDLRLVDWNVYARADELHVKVMEEEDPHEVLLLVDRSLSMTVTEQRHVGSLRLAAILGGLALVAKRRLRLLMEGAGNVWQGSGSVGRLLQSLRTLPEETMHEPSAALRQALEVGRPDLLWIGDFVDLEASARILARMRHAGVRVTCWLPEIGGDRVVDLSGLVRLRDPESGESCELRVDGTLQAAVQQELEELRAARRRLFREHGAALRAFVLPALEDHGLQAWEDVLWAWS